MPSPIGKATPRPARAFHFSMLGFAAVLVVGTAIFSAAKIAELRTSIGWVTDTLEVRALVAAVQSESQNADSQYLRYLLTQEERYRQEQLQALPQLERQLATLYELVMNNDGQRERVAALRKTVDIRNALIADAILRVTQDGLDASMPYLKEGQVAAINRKLRADAEIIEQIENDLLRGRQRELESALVQSTRTVLLVNALALLISAIAFFSLTRSTRQQHEQTLLEIRAEEAEAASKQKSAFLANMSHEIRTPMNAVFGFSQLLAKTKIEPHAREYLKAIQTSGKALLALINDILDLSKIEAGKVNLTPQSTDVRDLASSSLGVFTEAAQDKCLQLVMTVEPNVPPVLMFDPHRTRQILMNLLSNAIKYTERGVIRFRVRAERVTPVTCDLVISVEDSGIGLTEAHRRQLFEPFYRANEEADAPAGTGLGLAIVRKLLAAMGGNIEVQSAPGVGSTFTVCLPDLPISDHAADSLDDSDAEVNFATLAPSRILIVDDVSWNRDLLAAFLAEGEHALAFAEHGEEALKIASTFQPDVVLMDLKMPVLDGRAATSRMRQTPSMQNIKVVAVTASSDSRDEAVFDSEFDGYVRKPVSRELLFQVLHEVVGPNQSSTAETQQSIPSAASAPRDIINPNRRAAVLQQLRDIVDNQLASMTASLRVGELLPLASQLTAMGTELGEPSLTYFGQRLTAAVNRFDVLQMESLLMQLPEHIPRAALADSNSSDHA